jgi:hypothetical protein
LSVLAPIVSLAAIIRAAERVGCRDATSYLTSFGGPRH